MSSAAFFSYLWDFLHFERRATPTFLKNKKVKSPSLTLQKGFENQATSLFVESLHRPSITRTLRTSLNIFSDVGESSEEAMLTPSQTYDVGS